MESFKIDKRCITCLQLSLCETCNLPHCNGKDYVVDILDRKELNLSESFVKRSGNHIVAYDKAKGGDKAVLITARIDGDKVIIANTEVLDGEGLDVRT